MCPYKYATWLKAHDVPVLRVEPSTCDEFEDHSIYVTPSIHIQVPSCSGMLGNVVAEHDDRSFTFYPLHHAALITSIRDDLSAAGMN